MGYILADRGNFWGELSLDGRQLFIYRRGVIGIVMTLEADELGDLAELIADARHHRANTARRAQAPERGEDNS